MAKVLLTARDKKELGYITDNPQLYPIYKITSNLASTIALPKENLELVTNKTIKKYYLYLTQEIERELFSYVQIKEAGFSIGANKIKNFTFKGSSIPRANYNANGALTLGLNARSYIFYLDNNTMIKSHINLEENSYLVTWFMVDKIDFDSII